MSAPPKNSITASCSCGSVEFQAIGAPIWSAVCYCDDCQEGARQIEALPNASPVADPDGGTAYVLFRKDRFKCLKGAPLLRNHKIKEKSPTNRVVATCCNSAMMINFDDGKPWVSAHRARFQGNVPPLQMRVMTKYKPGNSTLPSDVPAYSAFPLRFPAKIVVAWIAMLFRR